MWIWLGLGILIGGAMGAGTMCLMQERHDDLLWQDLFRKFLKTDLENFDLRLEIADLKIELEDERYRHDRVQDFCVKVCDQLDAAKSDLKKCCACFTCKKNGVYCHVEKPKLASDTCCGGYRWRGEADRRVADAPRNDRGERKCGETVGGDCNGLRPRNDSECQVTDG